MSFAIMDEISAEFARMKADDERPVENGFDYFGEGYLAACRKYKIGASPPPQVAGYRMVPVEITDESVNVYFEAWKKKYDPPEFETLEPLTPELFECCRAGLAAAMLAASPPQGGTDAWALCDRDGAIDCGYIFSSEEEAKEFTAGNLIANTIIPVTIIPRGQP